MSDYYLDETHNILYSKNQQGYFEPYAINFNKNTNECELIVNNPYLFALIEYVHYVRRTKDARTGKFRTLPLFIYQWSAIIDMVTRTINPKSEKVLNTWSRQAKQNLVCINPFNSVEVSKRLCRAMQFCRV
jgi:hypothetical protein